MSLARWSRFAASPFASACLASACFALSCAPATVRPAPKPATPPRGQHAAPAPIDPPNARAAHKTRPSFPERQPRLGITTPMAGEPTASKLAESRLVVSSCEAVTQEDVDTRRKEMRAAVDQSFNQWHDAQPDCWEEMRQEYLWRREAEKQQLSGGGVTTHIVGRSSGGVSYGTGMGSGGTASAGSVGRPSDPSSHGPTVRTAGKASGTNNQVVGVDEADIVKTDGKFVYLAANGALRIVEALNPRVVSVTKLPGTTTRELFVEGDRAVVYTSVGTAGRRCTYGYDCAFTGDGTATKIAVFDITNRAAPKLTRELELSGSLVTARRIGNAVHTVVADGDSQHPPFALWPANFQMCGTPEAKVRETFAKLKVDNEQKIRATKSAFPTLRENGAAQPMCNGLLRTPLRDGKAFTSIVSFDLSDDATTPTTATIQSRPGAVYASGDALYFSVVHQKPNVGRSWYSHYAPSVTEVSDVHKFRIGATPKATRYVGSGTVPGHVLNQFAMDEWYGYLRVATTKGRVPDPKVESTLSILAETEGGDLTRIGAVDKIAPGEDIRAVRFDEDRGYVVTFKKTDPLFVLDLFEPQRPAILGELKIPGFSTYIHRIDPEHLLSIGFDANDHGSFAYFDGVILQLFDVKNATDPRLIHKEKIGTRGSSSEAATNHLAFNYFASEGLLAIPMTICEGGSDGGNGDLLAFSGLLVYDVDIERGFTRLGGVDHGTKGVDCQTWWSKANSAVKRSVFLDDLVYSIASDRVKVQRMSQFGTDLADLSLLP